MSNVIGRGMTHTATDKPTTSGTAAVATGTSPASSDWKGNIARKEESKVQLAVRAVQKNYHTGPNIVPVLRGVDLDIREGEFLAIVGQSGCGKSTLLHLLGTLDQPSEGEIYLGGNRIDQLSARKRDRLRNETFGLIFQFYHLLPELTAQGNVLLPLMIQQGILGYLHHRRAYRRRANELLEKVRLSHRLKHKPRELSGGEMQRTAIARALVNRPAILLADEPTGNLDRAAGREIIEILRNLNASENLTIVMVTHDEKIAGQADRTVHLVEGQIE